MRADSDDPLLHALATRAGAGDRAAFAELVERTHSIAYRLARRLVRSDADAADVLQDVYIAAWKGLPGLRDRAAVLGWLCRIVRNTAADRARSSSRRPVESLSTGAASSALANYLSSPEPDPERAVADAEARSALWTAVGELKEKHRVVLVLRVVDGMSYTDLAVALGISMGTVESRLHRARKELAAKLGRLLRKQEQEAA